MSNQQLEANLPIIEGDSQHKQVYHNDEDLSKANKIGNYMIAETIGEGAFGKVKKATHTLTGEKVAIKILNKQRMQQLSGDINKIQKEISILKKLRHKNLIQLYEILESKTNLFLIMEYCPKGELFDYIVKRKKLSEYTACKLFQNLIDGVDYLHCIKIVHRDLKPENLLLDDRTNLKITDFGLSTTYSGLISTPCGTPSYAPPEMLRGENYIGEKSDVWSCGIILFAMLGGYLPFAESKEEIICEKITNHDYKVPDFLSAKAKDLLAKMMEVSPERRIDLRSIREHPWFKITEPTLRQGLIIGVNHIPIDELILTKVYEFGLNNKYEKLGTKEEIRKKIKENKFESSTACYYLLLKKHITLGGTSISDLQSKAYLNYIANPSNLIDSTSMIYADHETKGDSKLTFSPKRQKETSLVDMNMIATASTKVTINNEAKSLGISILDQKILNLSEGEKEDKKSMSKANKSKTEERSNRMSSEQQGSDAAATGAGANESIPVSLKKILNSDQKSATPKYSGIRNSNNPSIYDKIKDDSASSKTTELLEKIKRESQILKEKSTKTHKQGKTNISNIISDFASTKDKASGDVVNDSSTKTSIVTKSKIYNVYKIFR